MYAYVIFLQYLNKVYIKKNILTYMGIRIKEGDLTG